MNGYYGEDWGLTNDGISELSSNQPLGVNVISDGTVQVYTKAMVNGKFISYYYIDDIHREECFKFSLARTWAGDVNRFSNIGDVISVMPKGTRLVNGQYAGGNICFYGIYETDYWTSDARDLFVNCVNSVATTCFLDEQCGEEEIGDNYCIGDDVYQDITEYSCEEAGTVQSECVSNTRTELVEICEFGCAGGDCLPECTLDSDCGIDYPSENYCSEGDVVRDFHDFECLIGSCSEEVSEEVVAVCDFGCEDVMCIIGQHDVGLNEFADSIGGIRLEYPNGTRLLEDPAILICDEDYKVYIEVENTGNFIEDVSFEGSVDSLLFNHNPITGFGIGGSSTKYRTVNFALSEGFYDINIEAIIPRDNNPLNNFASREIEIICPECFSDVDCDDDFSGEEYCSLDGDRVKDFHDFSCSLEGVCMEDVNMDLVEECGEDSCEEWGNNYCGLDSDVYHERTCYDRGCLADVTGVGCFEEASLNDELVEDCNYFCSNGECVDCLINSDCGIDYYSDNYCDINGDVARDQHIFSCSLEGECSEEIITEDVEICDDLCINGECRAVECYIDVDCEDYDSYTLDECNIPGTVDSYCTNTVLNCVTNNDCGITGFVGLEYCFSNDVYKDYQTSDCIAPATTDSHCEIDREPTLVNDCGINSCTQWENYCSLDELRKTRDCYNKGCLDGGCFNELNVEDNLVDVCEYGCLDGECLPECVEDGDCSVSPYVRYYCVGSNKYLEYPRPICELGLCGEELINQFVEACSYDCLDGECLNECIVDSDCPGDYYDPDFCVGDNIHRKLHDFSCEDNNCEEDISTSLIKTCEFGCYLGECLDECEIDSDCGSDYYDFFCEDNWVVEEYHNIYCADGECGEEVFKDYVKYCEGLCRDGECVDITCSYDDDCDDYDIYTIDQCNNPGTTQSYCTNIPMNCLSDNDCGITGFIGQEFCSNNDVFKTYQISDCMNEGTTNSYCEVNTFPMFLIDCGQDYCDSWSDKYCKNEEVYESRNCYDNSCTEGMCFAELFVDDKLVENCEFGCYLGECSPECSRVSDCGSDYCSNWDFICVNDDVWKRRTCNEYDCVSGHCEIETFVDKDFVQDCMYGCDDGECLDECSKDSDCGIDHFSAEYCLGTYVVKDFYDYECEYGSCSYKETIVLVKKCDQECMQGECVEIECQSHSDCEDHNDLTYDKCSYPGQYNSFCSNTPIECAGDDDCNPGEECINPSSPLSYCE